MNWKKTLQAFAKQKRAIVGLEAAIILIAFVIIAAVFSFMVVNQGTFATEQGKTVIQQGLQQASTPLAVDGTVFVKSNGVNVTSILVPLKTFGTKYISMNANTTVVTLQVGSNAWGNVYNGLNSTTTGESFNDMLGNTTLNRGALYIQNSNGDQALDASEKGYLVISLSPSNAAIVRSQVRVEVRLEKTAPLTVEFTIPESMPVNSWVNV